jgi:hypothetical protein
MTHQNAFLSVKQEVCKRDCKRDIETIEIIKNNKKLKRKNKIKNEK